MQPPFRVPHRPGWVSEFQAFTLRGNVVDLAAGIIIGAAFTSIVNSLVKDLFTPVLGVLLGGIDLSSLVITLKGTHEATLDAAQKAGAVTLNVGLFLNAVIAFVIVSFAIFWVVKALSRFKANEREELATLTQTESTLIEIPDLLKTSES